MNKKDERRLTPELPLMSNEFSPEVLRIGPKPEIVEKLMVGRSESVKSFMEADLDRLRGSIKVDQIKPKFQMLGSDPGNSVPNLSMKSIFHQDQMMNAEKDLRTGALDIGSTLPKTTKIEDSRALNDKVQTMSELKSQGFQSDEDSLRLPMHPELALAAAMKKLNQRSIR